MNSFTSPSSWRRRAFWGFSFVFKDRNLGPSGRHLQRCDHHNWDKITWSCDEEPMSTSHCFWDVGKSYVLKKFPIICFLLIPRVLHRWVWRPTRGIYFILYIATTFGVANPQPDATYFTSAVFLLLPSTTNMGATDLRISLVLGQGSRTVHHLWQCLKLQRNGSLIADEWPVW